MSTTLPSPLTPQGDVIALGIPDSQDYPRLVYCAPYFQQVPLAELIEPSVQESVEALLPSLVPPYVQAAADAAVQQLAVLKTGSTMSGPLMLAPLMPTADSMAATKAYVDAMIATAGVPEVPLVPTGQTWARQVGQWVPISEQEGTFLPLAGGTMQGQINMSGYAINNLAALPNMPNGAAPANWVLQQIASVSLYQGTWNMDTYVPDLTNPATHVNGYTWIAITTSTSGVVIGPPIPGLQGQTVFNGDTIIWSNIQGQFNRIHSGGLSLAEAQALFLPFTGGTMTGPLLAFENPTATMEVATMGWVESLLPPGGVIPEAPTDGQLYGRNGLTKVWLPVLPLAGGVMTGPIMLSGNATNALSPVPLQQMNSALASTFVPLAGGTMSGPLVLSGNASANLNPVPLQQVNSMLAGFLPISGGTLTGPITVPAGSTIAGYLPLTGGTLSGPLTINGALITGGVSNIFSGNALYSTYPTVSDFYFGRSGAAGNYIRVMNWHANSFDSWNEQTGVRGITLNGTSVFSLDTSGNMGIPGEFTASNCVIGIGTIGSVTFSGGTIGNVSNIANATQGSIGGCSFSGGLITAANCSISIGTLGGVSFPGSGNMNVGTITGTTVNLSASINAGNGTIGSVIFPGASNLGPTGNNAGSCGQPGAAWFQVAAYNLVNESDPRSKKDIAPSPAGALARVNAIPVQNFHWLQEDSTAPLHIGWMAPDVQAALGTGSATVITGTDENKSLALAAPEMTAILWQAVQELSADVTALKAA